jgi:hypothetical protein
MFTIARRVALVALCSGSLTAQVVACPGSAVVPYFGWDATDCGQCNIYGSYLEYLTPPRIRDVKPSGPAAGRLRDEDVLLAVDGLAITTPAAWHRMRDVSPGDSLRFSVRRAADTTVATVIPSARCAAASDPRIPHIDRMRAPLGARARTLTVGNALVEITGAPESVSYDPKSGEAVIVAGGAIVRVKPKTP